MASTGFQAASKTNPSSSSTKGILINQYLLGKDIYQMIDWLGRSGNTNDKFWSRIWKKTMKGEALVHLIWANREELVENIMKKVDCLRMNIKWIHDLQQKKVLRRKQKLTISEKSTSINSVITTPKGRKPRAERQFFPCFRKTPKFHQVTVLL